MIPYVATISALCNGLKSYNFYSVMIMRQTIVIILYLFRNKISNNKRILNNIFPVYIFLLGMFTIIENIWQEDYKPSEIWPTFYFAVFIIIPMVWIDYK